MNLIYGLSVGAFFVLVSLEDLVTGRIQMTSFFLLLMPVVVRFYLWINGSRPIDWVDPHLVGGGMVILLLLVVGISFRKVIGPGDVMILMVMVPLIGPMRMVRCWVLSLIMFLIVAGVYSLWNRSNIRNRIAFIPYISLSFFMLHGMGSHL